MNILNSFCNNIFKIQHDFIITLNGNACRIFQPELNVFVIENLVTGEMIDANKCEEIVCGFAVVSFVHNGEGYELQVGMLKTLNEIALINKEQN